MKFSRPMSSEDRDNIQKMVKKCLKSDSAFFLLITKEEGELTGERVIHGLNSFDLYEILESEIRDLKEHFVPGFLEEMLSNEI